MRKSNYVLHPKTRHEMLLNARLDKKLSLLKLSEIVGFTESYICRIENGKKKPTPKLLFQLFKALDCDIETALDWLLEDITIDLNKAGFNISSLLYTRNRNGRGLEK